MPVLKEAELRQTVDLHIFAPLGATDEEVARLQEHLVGANLRGHDSHGVRMCPTYVELWRKGDIVFGAELETLRESPAHAVLDAHKGLGQRMAWHAAQLAIEKASAGALAAVTLRNCSHIGRLGEYAEQIAAAGLIGFVTVNGQGGAQLVAPWGGVERRLSVNPFAWGIPAAGPFGARQGHHGRHLADRRGRRQGQRQAAARRALADRLGHGQRGPRHD